MISKCRDALRPAVCAAVIVCTALSAIVSPASARRRPPRHRAGCGTYCRQAGGLGGDPVGPVLNPARILSKRLTMRNGAFVVRLTCLLKHGCSGALVIFHEKDAPFIRMGGIDLTEAGGRTAAFEVPLSAAAVKVMHRLRRTTVTVTAFQRGTCHSDGSCRTTATSDRRVIGVDR